MQPSWTIAFPSSLPIHLFPRLPFIWWNISSPSFLPSILASFPTPASSLYPLMNSGHISSDMETKGWVHMWFFSESPVRWNINVGIIWLPLWRVGVYNHQWLPYSPPTGWWDCQNGLRQQQQSCYCWPISVCLMAGLAACRRRSTPFEHKGALDTIFNHHPLIRTRWREPLGTSPALSPPRQISPKRYRSEDGRSLPGSGSRASPWIPPLSRRRETQFWQPWELRRFSSAPVVTAGGHLIQSEKKGLDCNKMLKCKS